MKPAGLLSAKKSRSDKNQNGCVNVPWTGLEPARRFQHYPLKIACLPIPPPGHLGSLKYNEFLRSEKMQAE